MSHSLNKKLLNCNESMKWLTKMTEEFESLQNNQTCVLIERKSNQKVVSGKMDIQAETRCH